jgi:hypothetical protein
MFTFMSTFISTFTLTLTFTFTFSLPTPDLRGVKTPGRRIHPMSRYSPHDNNPNMAFPRPQHITLGMRFEARRRRRGVAAETSGSFRRKGVDNWGVSMMLVGKGDREEKEARRGWKRGGRRRDETRGGGGRRGRMRSGRPGVVER